MDFNTRQPIRTTALEPNKSHYDVVIIGSGAGGGTLARALADSGKSILILERGDWLAREPENWDPVEVFQNNRYVSKDPWLNHTNKVFQPGSHYFVGGASKMYGAAHFRMRERDFESISHVDGESPEWPIKYDVFEPYYKQAEEWYHVHGLRGEDPTEPRASSAYPYPPISHEPRMQKMVDDLKSVGLHPFHAPTGVALNEADPAFSACVRCNRCDGFPCLVHAKGDAEVMGVRPALDHDNVSLLTCSEVRRLNTDASGTSIHEVVVHRNGEILKFTGDIVVVSAGAANSARLLLMSANDKHPNGLANGSDQLGRNYMFHNCKALVALSHEPNTTLFQKTVAVNDWYFGDDNFDFPMGNIQMTGKTNGAMIKGYAPLLTAAAPTWSLDKMAEHTLDFWMQTEDLPMANNRVTVERDGQIKLSYVATNNQASAELVQRLRSMLDKLYLKDHLIERQIYYAKSLDIPAVGHQAGTCRFGTDPSTSVLDTNCKAHEIDNLYVVDTSFMPSISAVNPSLTAIANAIRVGDHLKKRLN
ncbi:MAG: dehydrogenase [Cyanobium sp. NAT70]|nr:dehydrogenase [Cyanobium sp. NAT70]|tara:strand:+ start:2792 stop:4390 length:1599 start_codon:yes stop_codon:yes gene_type:complete